MRVHEYQRAPAKPMAHALEVFEKQFTYPLGGSHSFRISHGEDYPRFFRAIGEASCFVAEQGGCVFGTLGAMVRSLLLPDGQEKKSCLFRRPESGPRYAPWTYVVQVDAVRRAVDGWPRVCGVWCCHGWNPGDSRMLYGSPGIPAV